MSTTLGQGKINLFSNVINANATFSGEMKSLSPAVAIIWESRLKSATCMCKVFYSVCMQDTGLKSCDLSRLSRAHNEKTNTKHFE